MPEPTIPAPPPFVGDATAATQDSAKARVVMIATEHDSRGEQVDVTDAWDAMLTSIERYKTLLKIARESIRYAVEGHHLRGDECLCDAARSTLAAGLSLTEEGTDAT